MYLLGSDAFRDLASRDTKRSIFRWLGEARPGQSQLFVSAISFGVVAFSIEALPSSDRDLWRRLLAEAKRSFGNDGGIIEVDAAIALEWARLRGLPLSYDDGVDVGDDELLVLATAVARDLTLVTRREGYHQALLDATTLKLIEP